MEFWLTTVGTYLSSLFLLTQPGHRFSAEEITSASLYLGTKLIEKKTGIPLMSRSLFDKFLSSDDQIPQKETLVIECSAIMVDLIRLHKTPAFLEAQRWPMLVSEHKRVIYSLFQ